MLGSLLCVCAHTNLIKIKRPMRRQKLPARICLSCIMHASQVSYLVFLSSLSSRAVRFRRFMGTCAAGNRKRWRQRPDGPAVQQATWQDRAARFCGPGGSIAASTYAATFKSRKPKWWTSSARTSDSSQHQASGLSTAKAKSARASTRAKRRVEARLPTGGRAAR